MTTDGSRDRARFASVDALLDDARSRLSRLTPDEAHQAMSDGARVVEIRPAWQRAVTGEIPGALVVERNHLEWRLDPTSGSRVAHAADGQRWVVVCAEGYMSSLAADALNSIGVPATDMIGGFEAWSTDGLPSVQADPTALNTVVPGEAADALNTNPTAGGPTPRPAY
ncbi:MAG: rhodanese-like domain-containing protein [bacterium]